MLESEGTDIVFCARNGRQGDFHLFDSLERPRGKSVNCRFDAQICSRRKGGRKLGAVLVHALVIFFHEEQKFVFVHRGHRRVNGFGERGNGCAFRTPLSEESVDVFPVERFEGREHGPDGSDVKERVFDVPETLVAFEFEFDELELTQGLDEFPQILDFVALQIDALDGAVLETAHQDADVLHFQAVFAEIQNLDLRSIFADEFENLSENQVVPQDRQQVGRQKCWVVVEVCEVENVVGITTAENLRKNDR